MLNYNDRKLLFSIQYAPVIVVGIFMVIINVIIFNTNSIDGDKRLNSLRDNAIAQQKDAIKLEVDRAFQHLTNQQKNTREKLKRQAKRRVEEAHAIALNIYQNSPDKSKTEVTKLIKDALRPIRFFEGRGYFFIFQMDGTNVLHSLRPNIEGRSQWDAQDSRGTYILQEHISLIDNRDGESFYQWWYPKEGEPKDKEFEKIGFGKYFAPFNWFIGTGEYLEDVEHDVQSDMLDWLEHYHYGEDGYIFALDNKQQLMAHPDPKQLDQNASPIFSQAIDTLFNYHQKESGFIEYNAKYMPGAQKGGAKISFVKQVDKWGWVIGTGFYLDKFEVYVEKQRAVLVANLQKQTKNMVLLSAFFTAITMLASLFVGRSIAKRFSLYQERISHDFKELEKTKNSLQHLALHDSLTQLPNRLSLHSTISKRIIEDRKNQRDLAIAFVDLDSFGKINDLYGHNSGDKLLSILSRKFEIILGKEDVVGRFGGDEFVFCFSNLNNRDELENKIDTIIDAFKDQFVIEGKIITSSCSIGISMFPHDDDTVEALIRKADMALHMSKSERKGTVRYYDDAVNLEIELNYAMEEQLKKSLSRGELSVMYQPQIDVVTGKMVGLEALARWNNPKLGQVPPDKFIHIAEETGLIEEIGLWIFRTACLDIISVSSNGESALNISINISPRQLVDANLPLQLNTIAQEIGIDVSRITLEITENILIDDIDKVTPILHHFRTLGFGLSLDDFGTGYSSLSYLNLLPITEIKIDRCFIDKLFGAKQNTTLVKSIIAIGASFDMEVVAEGVETEQQFEALKKYGCKLIQGYYFDRPLKLAEVTDRIANNSSKQRQA